MASNNEITRILALGAAPVSTFIPSRSVAWAAAVLQVDPGDDPANVKQAHRRICLLVHPDKADASFKERATAAFRALDAARDIANTQNWVSQRHLVGTPFGPGPRRSPRFDGHAKAPATRPPDSFSDLLRPKGQRSAASSNAAASTTVPPRPAPSAAVTPEAVLAQVMDNALNDALRPLCLRRRILARVEDHATSEGSISARVGRRLASAGCLVHSVLDALQPPNSCGYLAAALLAGLRKFHCHTGDTQWHQLVFPDLLTDRTVQEVCQRLEMPCSDDTPALSGDSVGHAVELLTLSAESGMVWFGGALSLDNFWRSIAAFVARASTTDEDTVR